MRGVALMPRASSKQALQLQMGYSYSTTAPYEPKSIPYVAHVSELWAAEKHTWTSQTRVTISCNVITAMLIFPPTLLLLFCV